jgi:hypothetical protein
MPLRHIALGGGAVLAALLLAPGATSAHGHSGHSFHHGFNRHFFGAWLYYGGYVVAPDYAPTQSHAALPTRVIYVPEPPQALQCHHSVQTVTVPAEAGGTRAVTVTRC